LQVIDPWGEVITELPDQVDVGMAELNFDVMKKVRTQMPINMHRRPDLYGCLLAKSPGEFATEHLITMH
jgi:predicted amidohydrolase